MAIVTFIPGRSSACSGSIPSGWLIAQRIAALTFGTPCSGGRGKITRVSSGRSSSRKSSPKKSTRGGLPFSVMTTCRSSSYSRLRVLS